VGESQFRRGNILCGTLQYVRIYEFVRQPMSSLTHTVLFYLTVYVQGRMTSKLEKKLTIYVNVIAHKYTFLQRLHSSGNVSLSVHYAAAA
jgi:hypothetical protein